VRAIRRIDHQAPAAVTSGTAARASSSNNGLGAAVLGPAFLGDLLFG